MCIYVHECSVRPITEFCCVYHPHLYNKSVLSYYLHTAVKTCLNMIIIANIAAPEPCYDMLHYTMAMLISYYVIIKIACVTWSCEAHRHRHRHRHECMHVYTRMYIHTCIHIHKHLHAHVHTHVHQLFKEK